MDSTIFTDAATTIAPIIEERKGLLCQLAQELESFGYLAKQSMSSEIDSLLSQNDFWSTCNHILAATEQVHDNLKSYKEKALDAALHYELQYVELLDDHSTLEADLRTAKAMSRSIASKASILRNRSITPILTLLWSITSKSANSQMVSEFGEIFNVFFQFIEKAEIQETNTAVIGILINVCASAAGRAALVDAIHKTPISVIKKIMESPFIIGDAINEHQKYRTKQLSLYLIHNLLFDEEICIELIKDGCIKFCVDNFEEFKNNEHERVLVNDILDSLINMKYVKTLNHYSANDLKQIVKLLNNDPNSKLVARINGMIQCNDESDQVVNSRPRRFGIRRIYPDS